LFVWGIAKAAATRHTRFEKVRAAETIPVAEEVVVVPSPPKRIIKGFFSTLSAFVNEALQLQVVLWSMIHPVTINAALKWLLELTGRQMPLFSQDADPLQFWGANTLYILPVILFFCLFFRS
jgi:hypothetical protein